MRRVKNYRFLLILFICLLFISIGYAAISNINFSILGGAYARPIGDLDVNFSDNPNDIDVYSSCLSGEGELFDCIEVNNIAASERTASFDIMNFKGYGDYAVITFKILNENVTGDANLSVSEVTNSSSQYFNVTANLSKSTIAPGEYSILTIRIKVIKVLDSGSSNYASISVTVDATLV